MKQDIRRAIRAVLLATAFALLLFYLITLVLTFPIIYPEQALRLEQTVSATIQNITLPIKIAQLSILEPDKQIYIPIHGIRVGQITDSWHDPRPDDRIHEGQDIFASLGTPVFSATKGYVLRTAVGDLGGNYVYVIGAGGRRYYYAHLDKIANGITRGAPVTVDTVLGYVGNTGNAITTPYHLHFGVYANRIAINPLPLLVDRKPY